VKCAGTPHRVMSRFGILLSVLDDPRVAKPPQRMPAVNSGFDKSKCEGCLGGSLSLLNFGKVTPSTQDP